MRVNRANRVTLYKQGEDGPRPKSHSSLWGQTWVRQRRAQRHGGASWKRSLAGSAGDRRPSRGVNQIHTGHYIHTDQYIPINTYRSIHTDECWTNYTKNTVSKLGLIFSFLMVHVMHFLTLVHAERGLMFIYNLPNVLVVVLRNLYNL